MPRIQRYPGALIIFWAVFTCISQVPVIHAENAFITIKTHDGLMLHYSLADENLPADRILETVERGLRSRITFTVRVMRKTHGLARLFGDKPVAETNIRKEARLDRFAGYYILTDSRGNRDLFIEPDAMIESFLSLDAVWIPEMQNADTYIIGRIRLEIIRLSEPLNLLSAFLGDLIVTTPWRRMQMPEIHGRQREAIQ